MSIRTIEAPGVEIKEIDKSAYTPAMTGTRAFVMGYANKGEPYVPMQFTSKSSWQLYYGEPDNEAERYFYNACSEVINQNGVLYCARLPYDNKANEKMVAFKYNVGTFTIENPTAGQYLLKDPGIQSWVNHNTKFEQNALKWVFDHNCYREINGIIEDGLENDTEICKFYNVAIERFNETYNKNARYRRYSIDYYKTNVTESQKLSARFGTKDEAIDHLKKYLDDYRLGHYIHWADEDSLSGICTDEGVELSAGIHYGKSLIRDGGDWIAQPVYADYNKEAVICANYTYNPQLNYVKDLVSCANDLSVLAGDKFTEIISVVDLKNDVRKILNAYAQGEYSDDTPLSTIGNIKEALQYMSDTKGDAHGEIKGNAYLAFRTGDLNVYQAIIEAIDLYGDLGENAKFEVPAFIDVNIHNDGANNEMLFNKKTSELFADETLDIKHHGFSEHDWEEELWERYKDYTLGQIIRANSNPGSVNPVEDYPSKDFKSFNDILTEYKEKSGVKFEELIEMEAVTRERIQDDVPFYRIADADQTFTEYLTIKHSKQPITLDLADIDAYRTGEDKVASDTFWIVDKTCATLNSIPEDDRKGEKRQLIGIFPVVTTAANALYAQDLITLNNDEISVYETVSGVITKENTLSGDEFAQNSFRTTDLTKRFCQLDKTTDEEEAGAAIDTISRDAAGYFLPIQMRPDLSGFEKDHAKKIGVVVVKAYLDASEGNKVSFNIVEAFVGSLDKNAKNPNTGVSTFLDNIINTQSEYIYFFSNCFAAPAVRKRYEQKADFFVCERGVTGMLGFFSNETKETISLPSLYQGIDKCFKNVEDVNERDIDIIPDAGLANIAQYLKSIYGTSGSHEYDLDVTDEMGNPLIKSWKCDSGNVSAWKTVLFKYDNFCKNVRKDCMFIADGPRPLVLQGQKKIVRSSKPSNTIDANILPNVKYITGLNTNYGAGYCDWFQITDEFTGDEFWCPPSIKAMGVYIYTDLNFEYWDAPAGLNRGVIQALDCAFSPTVKQAGSIYTKNWNYAINYPYDGIVLEGQKTFQVKPSCFDRVNVRRLFLRLERQTYKVARYFVYEGNTAYTRQRLIDMLDPIFKQAKIGGGVYDYKIICDESINTPTVIDNNELRVKIGIKPVKTAEFILIDFIALSTGGSFSEM